MVSQKVRPVLNLRDTREIHARYTRDTRGPKGLARAESALAGDGRVMGVVGKQQAGDECGGRLGWARSYEAARVAEKSPAASLGVVRRGPRERLQRKKQMSDT